MDSNKPQTSDEEGTPPPLLARTPFRPLSRQRRQALPPVTQSAVERPEVSTVFTASPSTIAAALAKQAEAAERKTLIWGAAGVESGEGDSGDVSGE